MRKGFNFYKSYWDVANELCDEDRLKFYDAIMKRQFMGEETELKGMVKFAYLSQKHSIDRQIDGYLAQERKKRPNEDPWQGCTQGATKGPWQQEKEKEQVKEKVKVKEGIEERKQKFALSLQPFVEKYGREFIKEFYLYWSEPTLDNKKLKYELEKTWSLERRLIKWESNAKKFGTTLPIQEQTKFKAPWQ